MEIAALLTGRGNNTLPDKNILPVFGKPLLTYPANEAKKVSEITSFYVSSDCDKILTIGESVGYKAIKRPDSLGQPQTQHIDVIDHAIEVMKSEGADPDILIVLLANTVTVKAEWITNCIDVLLNNPELTSCVPVYCETDHHPYRSKKIDIKKGVLEPFFDFEGQSISTNRQDLEPSYFLCHNFWVLNLRTTDRDKGQKPWVFMGDAIAPFIVEQGFDVHFAEDLLKSEAWLVNNGLV